MFFSSPSSKEFECATLNMFFKYMKKLLKFSHNKKNTNLNYSQISFINQPGRQNLKVWQHSLKLLGNQPFANKNAKLSDPCGGNFDNT